MKGNVRDSYRRTGGLKIRVARNLNRSEAPDLTYVADVGGASAAAWDAEMVIAYWEANPGLDVEYHTNNYYSGPVPFFVLGRLQPSGHPDVASGFVKGLHREYVRDGVIADLSELWKREGWDSVFPAALKRAVSYDEVPYFTPITFQWNPIWYRRDIFTELGLTPPNTWEELLSLCDSLQAAGYIPFTQSGRPWPPPLARWTRPGSPTPGRPPLPMYGAYMFADSQNPEEAEAFLAHLGSEAVQRDNYATLKYRTPARHDLYDQLTDLQRRQYDYIREVDHLFPLLEFNTRPRVAQAALRGFVRFWGDPSSADDVMGELERVRQEVFEVSDE